MTEQEVGLWLNAMKSGKYKQIQRCYSSANEIEYCALGILRYQVLGINKFLDQMITNDGYTSSYSIIKTLSDSGSIDDYKRVIKDVEEALEEYITEG